MAGLSDVTAHRLIPVVSVDGVAQAETLGRALLDGGLPVVEVVLRTPGAMAAVERLGQEPDLVVGAGTILTSARLDEAVAAGAAFLVSPGTSDALVARAAHHGVPLLPGAATATEVLHAHELGIRTVKFFPATTSGGPAAIAALSAPFGDARFIPTGGIDASNAAEFLAIPAVLAVGGSWMAPSDLIRGGDHERLTDRVRDAVASVA
jgi:2-dehydro-3-deoxyphosphogluconate aldolase/(4S)-4-hydroxy-2-oxoglutarate aldolase